MKLDKKILFIGILILFIITFFSVAAISASVITVTAKPSAINNLPYKDYTVTWKNHCPLCGHNDTLIFNPKGSYEGELTCIYCGADYCAVTGKDKHENGPRAELTPFKIYYNYSNIGTYFLKYPSNTSSNDSDLSNDNITIRQNLNNDNLDISLLNGVNLTKYSYIRDMLF